MAKVIVGITGPLYCGTSVGAQARAIGYIFHYFLGFPRLHGILRGMGIIIIYSWAAGMKAVTIIDVLQFIVVIIAVPLICNLGLSKIGGYSHLLESLPGSHVSISELSWQDILRNIEIFLIYFLTIIGPSSTVPRLLMARNSEQAKKAFYYVTLIYI